ncbi:hypothetical protein [Pseudomonas chlororaphis]|uniref:Uncharacterized protein n=1 Tax=Pseudomonas chlororaphis TaxID=587753 RepID=A0AAX3G1A8_9PSED|nr:hypothetical protein [Pseudomonas chlororaphis]AZC35927.1 hypothetical protein C4K37_1525 [Pseudomonas chlororaphis subsp. piscium]AZC42472.1 hypothetical protein C4K36_1532 [Pseudomonas chlororaphis subsp. piscium]WDG74394.1 hypothetical protein PUP65_08540 [Pseudomonas chlororaphis]WDH27970.1 hypothetical protein PUP81_25770 [Pseudomonas chlororaphis]WDH72914.1 hypothetical protein PUP78_08535 [Pseudomonas chlororaphis]
MSGKKVEREAVWKYFSVFNTGLSLAERIGTIFVFLFITASSTATGFLAKLDPVLKELGPVYWVGLSVCIAVLLALFYYLFRSAVYRQAQTEYYSRLTVPKNQVNPLDESFKDVIIYIEDLRLPTLQVHRGKHFKRCKFVGHGTIALMGGNIINNTLAGCGDLIAVPEGTLISGTVVFLECTIESCEFVNITILADQYTAKAFLDAGMPVKGLVNN